MAGPISVRIDTLRIAAASLHDRFDEIILSVKYGMMLAGWYDLNDPDTSIV